ncbi:cupin-like domain-containing protein [Croceicoccus marinus]|uniref:JmjC domain-containing protein n=1 Tax=Croceicoccus marinus TaxID=450378 RepID=A0A1Z1FB47_9SPHN|nr:cupin-like domain-containing protein [Croceicoccus marinus]ARU16021.1 hypothetical protein A9D14_07230 [Croceicoccus marinus]
MTTLPQPAAIDEFEGKLDAEQFAILRKAGQPVVLRGLVADWPAVAAASGGDRAMAGYMAREPSTRPVTAIAAPPSEGGRFFYTPDLSQLNFSRGQGRLEAFIGDLITASDLPDAPALAVQSEDIADLLPRFAAENRLALLPQVRPRIWIGNRIRVAPHYDLMENVACCVAGQRRFTLFPPDQIANLYPGSFELTPAGTPVSMVDTDAPDLDRFPRFEKAWAAARQATLEPGDAIYIPYCWWHGVESLGPLNILVNYWWNEGEPEGIGSPYSALLHGILSVRHLPPEKRAIWKTMFDYYVFEEHGDPVEHLPVQARGLFGSPSPALFARMREIIRGLLR